MDISERSPPFVNGVQALLRNQFILKQNLTTMSRDKDSTSEFKLSRQRRMLLAAAVAAVGMLAFGCAKNPAAAPSPPGVPVVVARVSQQAMPVEVTSVGNVEAISTISIKSQVAGQLLEVHFKEGDFVHNGQLLLTIDSRPYQMLVEQAKGSIVRDQAQIQQAEANLAKDSAQEEYARGEAQRDATLMERGVIPKETLEQVKSQAAAALQSLRADQAAIESARANLVLDQGTLNGAKLQLSYCTIYSPIDGRTGAVLQKPGNLLKAADVPIVVINQVDPIYVNFTVPQQYWSDINKHVADRALRVTATVPQDSGKPQQGTVSFVDNAVDPTTGTIHLRATFENSQNRLWPGLFVNVVLRLSEQPNATVVPMQAITQGQNGTFVYVVKSDNTVEPRPVVSSRTISGLAVIDKGLDPDEVVVTDGQTRLTRGSKVQIKSNASEAGPF
jgi:multidrug efflux system membrane fusion protein